MNPGRSRAIALAALVLPALALTGAAQTPAASGPRFDVRFTAEQSREPLDGRLLVMLSTDDSKEPASSSTTASRPSRSSGATSRE